MSPASITKGGSTTLSWSARGASSFTIDHGIGGVSPATGGSTSVSPAQTTTYTGTATGPGGKTVHCAATVQVTTPPPPPATACTLSAAPASIAHGGTTTLTWTSQNADTFSIDHGIGGVTPPASGSVSVSPAQTTTYTATATGSDASAQCSVTVTVAPPSPVYGCTDPDATNYDPSATKDDGSCTYPSAPTCTLSADPASISQGGTATLSWTTTGADALSLDQGIGAVTPVGSGSTSVSPTATTTYTGTVTGPGGTATCHTTVKVVVPPPVPTTGCIEIRKETFDPTGAVLTPVAQFTFVLDGTRTTQNDANGDAIFTNVPLGTHQVTEKPAGDTWKLLSVTPQGGTIKVTAGACVAAVFKNQQVIPPSPAAPTCTLTADPTHVTHGGSSVLSWATTGAAAFSIDQGIGAVAPIDAGSTTTPALTADTAYTGTVTGPGGTAHCTATVQVIPPSPAAPTCTLTADPESIVSGGTATLSWTTTGADALSLDQGIGAVTPVGSGSTSVSPTATTTYTGTVTGPGGTAHCTARVATLPPSPETPTCTLSAASTQVTAGNHTTLTWQTTSADTFSIDQGIGAVTPAVGGSVASKAITADTTFTGTVTSPTGHVVTCSVTVTVGSNGGGGGGPACTLSASPSSVSSGSHATLSWTTSSAVSFSINQGIGAVTAVSGGSTTTPALTAGTTYTGTATDASGATVSCQTTVTVPTGGGAGGGGGGGGGGGSIPDVVLASLAHPSSQPLTYLYLSQIPYTGLDLGPVGTATYWAVLLGLSLVLSYLVLFVIIPYGTRATRTFGTQVSAFLNAPEPEVASEPVRVAPVAARADERHDVAAEPARGYSAYEGFKSLAHEEALTIEDIVHGLSRNHAVAHSTETVASTPAPASAAAPAPVWTTPEQDPEPPRTPAADSPVIADVRGFVIALAQGDRAAVFAGLRQHARGGGAPEALLSAAACLLDDAYRARIEGAASDPTVARVVARLDTPKLEQVIAALATAIDASYTNGVTGAKLALTRALSEIGA